MSIELKNVTFTYSQGTAYESHALKDINLVIPDGQFIGVIGHTGSGKSTLIQHFNALIQPTSGQVLYNGEDVWAENYDRRALRSEVGLVFQYPEHQLFENTVLADVCFGPMNQGLSKEQAEEEAKKALSSIANTGCFGSNQALMVHDIQNSSLYKLCLHNRRNHLHHRLSRENNGTFRDCINIAGKMK